MSASWLLGAVQQAGPACAAGLSRKPSHLRALPYHSTLAQSQWTERRCSSLYVRPASHCSWTLVWRYTTAPSHTICCRATQLTDVDGPDAITPADAVLLTVRADDEAPFAGLFRYMDALARPTATGAGALEGTSDSATDAAPVAATKLPGSQTDTVLSPSGFLCSPRSCGTPVSSGRHTSRTNTDGAHGTGAHGSHTVAEDPALQLDTAGVAKGDTPVVGRLDTGRVSTTSSLRERVPAVYQGLSLTTTPVKGKDPFAKATKGPPKRRRKPSFHTAVPVAVAVTACDIVDSEEHQAAHPGHVDNLRSMAANWSNAHRCRVTFVSAKTGVGISGAIAHLIEEVFVQRRQAVREKSGGEEGATAQRVAAAAAAADARSRTPKLAPPLPSAVQHMA